MKDSTRLAATLIIWIAFSAVAGSTLTSATGPIQNADGNTLFGIVALLAASAMISTISIWLGGWRASVSQQQESRQREHSKQKRAGQSRIARLIEELDDEEIYDLEALLLARDHASQETRGRGT